MELGDRSLTLAQHAVIALWHLVWVSGLARGGSFSALAGRLPPAFSAWVLSWISITCIMSPPASTPGNYICASCVCCPQVLPQELSTQWSGMRLEPICLGIQTCLPPIWNSRPSGFNPAGCIHAGWSDASQDDVSHGRRGTDCSFCLEGGELKRGRVHHTTAPRSRDLPHEGASLILQCQRDHWVPDHIHSVHSRVCLSVLRSSPKQTHIFKLH